MKIVIIGNGISGITAAKTIREKDNSAEIEIYSDEKYHYYVRPSLIDFLAGHKTENELYFYNPEWYDKNNIKVKLDISAQNIDLKGKSVIFENGDKKSYDKLLISTGASSNLPPIKGSDKKNVFTLRCLEDAKAILESVKNSKNLVIIGGGVLGLEVANALKKDTLEITVLEVAKYLLPRQLDEEGGVLLKKIIEKKGIKVICGVSIDEVYGDGKIQGIKFKDGSSIPADMVIISAGVKPNIEIAKNSGLKTNRGIIVNEYLETSDEDVYATGDVAEFNGICYGIVPACIEQSKIAAANICSPRTAIYGGTVMSNTLKVVGVDLTTEGNIFEKDTIEYKKIDDEIYKKIFVKDGKIIGSISLGDKKNIREISKLIKSKISLSDDAIKSLLL